MTRPSAFITGITGFAGSYLAEELLAAGFDVRGSVYYDEPTGNIAAIKSRLRLYALDILDAGQCRRLLSRLQPNYIFHLAAIASVGESFRNERSTFAINFDGTVNLLEAATRLKKLRKFLFVGSSDSYGVHRGRNKTLTEDQPFNPVSPYGISKAAAEFACRYYYRRHGLPVVVARAFNHSGPRQNTQFVIPAFAEQIARIESGLQKPEIRVGDLTARRDISDVRDIVRGYRLAAVKGRPDEVYQLCSGRAVTIRAILDALLAQTPFKIKVRVDRNKLRRSEIPVLRGSHRKAAQRLGYRVRYRLKDTLRDTLEYWRSRYRSMK